MRVDYISFYPRLANAATGVLAKIGVLKQVGNCGVYDGVLGKQTSSQLKRAYKLQLALACLGSRTRLDEAPAPKLMPSD